MGIDAKMLVKTTTKLTKQKVRKLSYRICDAFYRNNFYLYPKQDEHALTIVKEYEQDGDSIFPEEGEIFINVNLAGRYYGEGYERGPIHDFIMIAQWLEYNIENCQIFYGGDSSGVCAEPFDKEAIEKIFKHFSLVGHLPYSKGFTRDNDPPICNFCNEKTNDCGGGAGSTFFRCNGCGLELSKDNYGNVLKHNKGLFNKEDVELYEIKDASTS